MAIKDLITLAQFKEYKNINSTEQDALLNSIITRVSQFVKTYCGKTFVDYVTADKIEYFDGVGIDAVFLDEQPILSITSVEVSNNGGSTYETPLVSYTDYFINYDIGMITSAYSNFVIGSSVAQGLSNRSLKVKYRGGYKSLPADISQATLDLVEFYRANEYTPRQSFQSFQTENLGFRAGSSTGLPSHIRRVLDMYREL